MNPFIQLKPIRAILVASPAPADALVKPWRDQKALESWRETGRFEINPKILRNKNLFAAINMDMRIMWNLWFSSGPNHNATQSVGGKVTGSFMPRLVADGRGREKFSSLCLRQASSIVARRIVFPLLFLSAGLVFVQPCAGQGAWTSTGFLATARTNHTATLLPNGGSGRSSKVLVTGGTDIHFNPLPSAELYDPATGTWTPTNSLNTARTNHTATLLPNGKVLVAGGSFGGDVSAELYNPVSETWTYTTGPLHTARYSHTATMLPNGKVLVAGGKDSNGFSLPSAELYDPVSGTWTATQSLANARYDHTATLLRNGKVLVAGGKDSNGFSLPSAELYNPASRTWTATGPLNSPRYSHTATTLLPSGKVLVAGGWDGTALPSAELYDPATGTWTLTTGPLHTARYSHTATLLPNGKVLVAGGKDSNGFSLQSAELYYQASQTWTAFPLTGLLATARGDHTATLLPNAKVLVAGGDLVLAPGARVLDRAELYEFGGCKVVNGDFETGSLPPWISSGDTSLTGVDQRSPHSGSFALFAGPTSDDGFIDQVLPTVAGKAYDVSFWLKNDDDSGNNRFGARLGGFTLVDEAVQGAFGGYTLFTFNNVIPGANADLHFIFYNPFGNFYLDDVCVTPSAPTFDKVDITLITGNDNAGSGVEITGQLSVSGQSTPQDLCLKRSAVLPPDICMNGPGAPTWDEGIAHEIRDVTLDTPQASAAGFGWIRIALRQTSCGLDCDNWDIQGIKVIARDSTNTLRPATLIDMMPHPYQDNVDNCLARLKGLPHATTVQFNLDSTNGHIYVDGNVTEFTTTCKNNGDQ